MTNARISDLRLHDGGFLYDPTAADITIFLIIGAEKVVLAKYSLTPRYSVDIYGGLVSPLVSLVISYAKLDKT